VYDLVVFLQEGRHGSAPVSHHARVFCAHEFAVDRRQLYLERAAAGDQPLPGVLRHLYVLRTGCPWRDLPSCYGNWHSIYMRFKRGSERGLWWRILITLQQHGKARLNIVLIDSTTWKVHRHGGGSKGGTAPAAKTVRA
jgi:transposase